MRPELERIKYIEDYLEGRLSEKEAREFEAVMESNPDLKKDVNFQKDLGARLGHAALVSQVEASHQKFIGKKPFWYNLNTWIAIGAIGLATIAAVLGYHYGLDEQGQHAASNTDSDDQQQATTIALEETTADDRVASAVQSKTNVDDDINNKAGNDNNSGLSNNNGKLPNADNIDPLGIIAQNTSAAVNKINHPIPDGPPVDNPRTRWFKEVEVPYSIYTINADSGGHFWHPSGTWVYIPPKALETEGHTPVHGEVKIKYREFRNQSEIFFSKFPMTYHGEDEEYNFNSAGMFEIRAYGFDYGNLRVKPTKEIVVDFALNDTLDRLACYKLDMQKEAWWKLQDISIQDMRYHAGVQFDVQHYEMRKHSFFQNVYRVLTGWAWDDERWEKWEVNGRGKVIKEDTRRYHRKLDPVDLAEESDTIFMNAVDSSYRMYPTVVRGIKLEDIGVYNCDQLYRPKRPVEIRGRFYKPGNYQIKNIERFAVIDLEKNTAFTYQPKEKFTIDLNCAQAIVAITDRNELYYIDANRLGAMDLDKGGFIKFLMDDISNEVETPGDLQQLLLNSQLLQLSLSND